MAKKRNIRARGALILASLMRQQQSLNAVFPVSDSQLSEQDEALLQALCYGTCRHFHSLQSIAEQLLDKALKEKDSDVLALLLLGLYQMRHMRVPDHAAIGETVQACKQLGKGWASGLLNALLRRFQREHSTILQKLESEDAFQYSHPTWLLAQIKSDWPQHWPQICAANNEQAPLCLRVNEQQGSREDYRAQLAERGIENQAGTYSAQALYLQQALAVTKLPGFETGAVSVQDEAAQLAAGLLDPQPGMRVLDACAAPGGKSCHLLERQPDLEELVAVELEAERLLRIEDNLARLNLQAHLITGDAGQPESWWDNKAFDRILLDAPCSASGVIRRHPDIKLLRRSQDIGKLATQQLQLLIKLWPLLKPGGKLLYATCSILAQENEQVVAEFLQQQQDALHLAIDADWGIERKFGRQLLPQPQGQDGFFYCALTKVSE